MGSRKKLLDAAATCLQEQGSHSASIKAIAGIAGVNHGLIHHYFGSKEGLFIELVQCMFSDFLPSEDSPLPCLESFIHHYREVILPRNRLLVEMRALAYHMPLLAEELVKLSRKQREALGLALGIDSPESQIVLAAFFSGLGMLTGIDSEIDLEAALKRILEVVSFFDESASKN